MLSAFKQWWRALLLLFGFERDELSRPLRQCWQDAAVALGLHLVEGETWHLDTMTGRICGVEVVVRYEPHVDVQKTFTVVEAPAVTAGDAAWPEIEDAIDRLNARSDIVASVGDAGWRRFRGAGSGLGVRIVRGSVRDAEQFPVFNSADLVAAICGVVTLATFLRSHPAALESV